MRLREALQELVQQEITYATVGIVKEVDPEALTCVVAPLDESPDLLDVRIDTNLNATEGFQLIPRVDSRVIVGFMDEDTAYVAMTSEVDEFRYNVEDTSILFKSDEVALRKGDSEIVIDSEEAVVLRKGTSRVDINSSDEVTLTKGSSTIGINASDLLDLKTSADSLKGLISTFISEVETGGANSGGPVAFAHAFAQTKAALATVLA